MSPMPQRLHRYYGAGYSHFITTSCYQRAPLLGSRRNRDLFLHVLEQVRHRYHFVVVGYVVMPEHVHLLIGEPQRGDPSVVMKALKQGFARRLLARLRRTRDLNQRSLWQAPVERGRIWQPRFYDFVVFSEHKRVEKLRYMHRNPVKRGLVLEPQQWAWSSFRHYACDERGHVLVNEPQKAWGSRFRGCACPASLGQPPQSPNWMVRGEVTGEDIGTPKLCGNFSTEVHGTLDSKNRVL
jgi:REP-associated tyrosine transposase